MRLSTENRRQTLSAACAGILRAALRCINIQAGQLHVKPTAGLPGRRHREDPFHNRTPTDPLVRLGAGNRTGILHGVVAHNGASASYQALLYMGQ
jgi:hypothetical protein